MKKENLPVVIAIALPILLILVVAIFAYVPKSAQKLAYNFVFLEQSASYARAGNECVVFKNTYTVENNAIKLTPLKQPLLTDTAGRPMSAIDKEIAIKARYGCYTDSPFLEREAPKLYLYNADVDAVEEITFEQASKLQVVGQRTSPDGYTVGYKYVSNGIFELFGSNGNNSGMYATKRDINVPLNLASEGYYNNSEIDFLAWVAKN